MDASQVTKKNQNQMIFAWYWDRNLLNDKIAVSSGYDTQLNRLDGGDPSLERAAPVKPVEVSIYNLDLYTLSLLDELLMSVSGRNLGPTRTSRIAYLWFLSVCSGYNWSQVSGPISGTLDSWNWDTRFPIRSGQLDVFMWMIAVFLKIMPVFLTGYNTSFLKSNIAQYLGWTVSALDTRISQVQTDGNWTAWETAWDTWYTYRAADGSVAAATAPADSDLPNGSQTLEVTTTTDDPNNFTAPSKWVPLKISGSKKNYLTYGWGDVTSTGLSSAQETAILDAAQTFFPGTASSYDDGSARANEIAEVITITGNLTETQKMIAEFWAGGPFTVSPPGMFIWFWRQYMAAIDVAKTVGLQSFFYSGLDLAIHLFETGRLVWNSKKINMQARPIQEIRRMYRGQTLTKYDGTSILGEAWVPYQESNFVTPPFPDFPSGHSAFSQTFANIMKKWFGEKIEDRQRSLENLSLISPIFNASQTNHFGTFLMPVESSQIQFNVVPSQILKFTYTTWQEMANEAGLSRKYGGIHATSAHTGSQALANALYGYLQAVWNIRTS
jgi:hypothetical protein